MIVAALGGFDLGQQLQGNGPVHDAAWVVAGIVVMLAFVFAARLFSKFAGEQLHRRHVRSDMVVLGRRAVTALIIVLGVFAALGFAVQSANVTLFGLLLATIVAALGVQTLLQDYVSGYYVLLERHLRVGDHITFDGISGTITEVRLRVTLLKGAAGEEIIVPNSELFTKAVSIRRAEARPEHPA